MKKIRVGVLFGGRSGEHEVSLLSAASVLEAIDKTKYEVVPIGITKDGRWLAATHAENLLRGQHAPGEHLRAGDPHATSTAAVLATGSSTIIPPMPQAELLPFQSSPPGPKRNLAQNDDAEGRSPHPIHVDIIFPVLHGTFGEDGTIQGLLELADIPYVGAGVLGSAAGMDKDVMKRLFAAAGLPIVKHVTVLRCDWHDEPKQVRRLVEENLKYPLFVKPANLGSSVGISKVHEPGELAGALEEAASYDRKIVVEEAVGGKKGRAREIECAVLGNDKPAASIAGEIIPIREFYDYAAKYLEEGSELVIPAKLTKKQMRDVQQMAILAFCEVECSGLARVDFLMDPKNQTIYVNEINSMPGFTSISMYPKLWAASGVSYPELIDRLIKLGFDRHEEKKKNRYSRQV